MEGVKKTAVNRAVMLLVSIGAQFKIIVDGEQFGTLEVAKPKKAKKEPKYRRSGISYAPLYKPVMEKMAAGDCKTFIAENGMNVSSLRNIVSAAAVHMWGKGNAITAHKPDGVEVLRLK